MAKIHFIRHGQASFAADNYDKLSETGIAQAKLLNNCLQDKQLTADIVITGSMLRHQQTADFSLNTDELSNITNVNTVRFKDERWNEYDHQNILAVYKEEFATPQSMRDYLTKQADPKGAFQQHFIAAMNQWISSIDEPRYSESWQSFSTRVISALTECAKEHHGKTVLVYSSGGPISLVASQLLGLPLTTFMDINWTLVNAGITKVIAHGKSTPQLMLSTLNEHHIFEQHNKKLITYT